MHREGRAVSDIIATILLVAITVVLAAVLYILISGLATGPSSTPVGAGVSFGGVTESTNPSGPQWNYTASVQTTTSSLTWSDLLFQVRNGASAVITTGPTTVGIAGTNGCALATFTFTTQAWSASGATCTGTTGGSALVLTGESFQLRSTVDLNNQGNSLTIIGQGSFSGQTTLNLP
jgi:flagellin-like protein